MAVNLTLRGRKQLRFPTFDNVNPCAFEARLGFARNLTDVSPTSRS